MKTHADHLRELELGAGATRAEIRQAYRDLARVWHPDRFASDPRMQAKASDKLRRIIEAYDYLEAHPNASAPPSASRPDHRAHRPQASRPHRPPSRQDHLRQALANLEHRVRLLERKVDEVNKRGVTSWEHRAWIGLACGMGVPIALVFIAGSAIMPVGVPLYVIFVGSCLSVFGLALYHGVRLFEETREELQAVTQADVVCGRCGRGVAGFVLPTGAHDVLVRAGWAHAHLKCPRCRRALA
jgi:hypothetical protein